MTSIYLVLYVSMLMLSKLALCKTFGQKLLRLPRGLFLVYSDCHGGVSMGQNGFSDTRTGNGLNDMHDVACLESMQKTS